MKRLAAGTVKERVRKELIKGILALPVAVAGVFIIFWGSHSGHDISWIRGIIGFVIFAIGLGGFMEFLESLIVGELAKGVVAMMKEFVMKEWMKVFLGFISILAGICCVMNVRNLDYYFGEWVPYCIGIVLMAGGITFFWTRSKFYKG